MLKKISGTKNKDHIKRSDHWQDSLAYSPEYISVLYQMLQELVKTSDDVYSHYAFARDPLRGKLSFQQKEQLLVKANQCGQTYADKIMEQYSKSSPEEIAKDMNLIVNFPYQPTGTDYITFAHFQPPKTISVYRHSLEKAEKLLNFDEINKVMEQVNIKDVLIAHELFHVVEEKEKNFIFTRKHKINLWAPPFFHNRSTVRALSEIAGMAFAKRLTGLSYSPFLLDIFLVYGYSFETAKSLYNELKALNNELSTYCRNTL